MPFPIDLKYIEEFETQIGVIFPPYFKAKMQDLNGGEIIIEDEDWNIFPFLDKLDSKRISRTCNHIGLETQNAKEWNGFPNNSFAIGDNGFGDYLVLKPHSNNPKVLLDTIFIWRHETAELYEVANSILDLMTDE